MSLAEEYSKRDVVMQLHMQASRNNNTRGFKTLGPDTGYDGVTDREIAHNLSRFLDTLDMRGSKTGQCLFSIDKPLSRRITFKSGFFLTNS